jgi:hypothetical protein
MTKKARDFEREICYQFRLSEELAGPLVIAISKAHERMEGLI